MAYYKPCKNCAVDKATCERRAEIAGGISGLSITVVNFRCTDRQPIFHNGQRIAFNWTSWERDDWGNDSGLGLIYHGTVIEEHSLRFIVRIDDAPSADTEKVAARDTFKSENLVIKVKPSDMQALNEPDRQMCAECSAYVDEPSRCFGWGEAGSLDRFWPRACLRKMEFAA